MRRTGYVTFLWLVGLLLVAARPAVAQQDGDAGGAGEFFRAANAAYERGDYRAAALAFEEAHRRAPRAATIYNAGRSWDDAARPKADASSEEERSRAADAYEEALAIPGLDAPDVAFARERLQALGATLGVIDVRKPEGARVSVRWVEQRRAPLHVHVPAGPTEVRVMRRDGSTVTVAVVVVASESAVVEVDDAPLPPPHKPIVVGVPSKPSTGRTVAWIALGTAAAVGAAGVVTGVLGLQAKGSYDAGGDTDNALRSKTLTLRDTADVLDVTAIVLGVGGGVLMLLTSARSSGATPSGGASALTWTGRDVAWRVTF